MPKVELIVGRAKLYFSSEQAARRVAKEHQERHPRAKVLIVHRHASGARETYELENGNFVKR